MSRLRCTSVSSNGDAEPQKLWVLPLRLSLFFSLTEKQWKDVRERHKKLFPGWERCPSCPKMCKTHDLDEKWSYDSKTHTKVFLSAQYICKGCHWFKTPTLRLKTWLDQQQGILPPMLKLPHIIDCLGYSQEQVEALRDSDLREHQGRIVQLAQIDQGVKEGKAALLPAPAERLPQGELQRLVRPGQLMVAPFRVNLAALAIYRYSESEIAVFEERMYQFAAKRIAASEFIPA
jgi:hypothetical protein